MARAQVLPSGQETLMGPWAGAVVISALTEDVFVDPLLAHATNWKRLQSYITGSGDQELLPCNEYPATENRILRSQLKGRPRLTDPERRSLAEISKHFGRKSSSEVVQIVRPEYILA
jgi:hypothetical protein